MLASSSITQEPLLAGYTLFDRQLAEALQHTLKHPLTLSQRAFICHLSAAMRQGHLCVHISQSDANAITPSPEAVMETTPPSLPELLSALQDGAASLTTPFLSKASTNNSTPIIQDQERFYFRRYWQIETDVIKAVTSLSQAAPLLPCSRTIIEKLLQEALHTGTLEVQQADAIARAVDQPLCWITGGPGTGKTHTAGQLIRFLYLACSEEDKKRFRLILAAPTGKAATQLEASVLRAAGQMEGFPKVQSQTLHRLLGLSGTLNTTPTRIHADCILIDEASMIDAELIALLLSALTPGTRVLFLGDADQLPAVDAGALFADFLKLPAGAAGFGARARLSKSRRTESPSLLRFARSVQMGDEEEALQVLQEGQGVRYIPYRHLKEAHAEIIKHAAPLFNCPQEACDSAACLAAYLQQFRLLSPLREGELGFETLNLLLHQEHVKQVAHTTPIIPLLVTRNQADLEIWNGEMGVQTDSQQCLFVQKGALRRVPRFHLAAATYGYCVSVHKSQGSEWDEVFLVLPEGSLAFGRELLYTAATRAKKRLTLLAREETLRKMISRSDTRCSGILQRLAQGQ